MRELKSSTSLRILWGTCPQHAFLTLQNYAYTQLCPTLTISQNQMKTKKTNLQYALMYIVSHPHYLTESNKDTSFTASVFCHLSELEQLCGKQPTLYILLSMTE